MFLSAVFLPLAVAAGVLGQDTDNNCAVRAYVRAADLHQNEISHGELRVNLIGSNCSPLARVGLRLTLDEYAETKAIGPPPDDFAHVIVIPDHKLENYTAARTESASIQQQAFSTGMTWNVNSQQLDSEEGFVQPFSVAMPNVQYPSGVTPVKFQLMCASSDYRKMELRFGRVYRYAVWVQLEDGKFLNAPAGYTSFVIGPTSLDRGTAEVLEMMLQVPREQYFADCRHPQSVDAARYCPTDDSLPSMITVKMRFPQGNVIVPGQKLKIQLELLEPEPVDSETRVEILLRHQAHVLKSPPPLNETKCHKGYSQISLLSSSSNTTYGSTNSFTESKIQYGALTVLTLDISPNFPIDAPGAFFTSQTWINMRIIRRQRINMNSPNLWRFGASSLVPEGYVQGGLSKISGRWAYDPDGMPEIVAYDHDFQLPLVRPKSVGLSYSQALESTEQPIMAPGHVQTRAEAEEAGAHFEFKLREPIDIPLELDSFIGQYVGVLWTVHEKDLAAVQAASPINTVVTEQVVSNQ